MTKYLPFLFLVGCAGARIPEPIACLDTDGRMFIYDPDEESRAIGVFQMEKGCRCSYRVDGISAELITFQSEDMNKCRAYKASKLNR